MKIKPSKIILILSFLPYLIPIAFGIYEAAYNSGYSTATGSMRTPAIMFIYGFFGSAAILCTAVPIFLSCFAYQIFYLVRAKSQSAASISPKKYWLICAAVCFGVFIIVSALTFTLLFLAALHNY